MGWKDRLAEANAAAREQRDALKADRQAKYARRKAELEEKAEERRAVTRERRAELQEKRDRLAEQAATRRARDEERIAQRKADLSEQRARAQERAERRREDLAERRAKAEERVTAPAPSGRRAVRPRKFAGIRVDEEKVSYKREKHSVAGIDAQVETAGEIDRRLSLTRTAGGAVLLGPLGALLGGIAKKKKDSRQAFLLVSGPEFAWAVEVNSGDLAAAHEFAAHVRTIGKRSES